MTARGGLTVREWLEIQPVYRWLLLVGGVRPPEPKARNPKKRRRGT
jgi:hypothetical protein